MKWLRFLGAVAVLAGCRTDFGDTPGQRIDAPLGSTIDAPNGGGTDSPPGALTTVKAIRQNPPGPAEVVQVRNVIVVARVRTSTRVNFFVQDQGGGEFSGIQVFCPRTAAPSTTSSARSSAARCSTSPASTRYFSASRSSRS